MTLPPLYPLVFHPYIKKVIWGGKKIAAYKEMADMEDCIGESWEISDLEGFKTAVANGELKGLTIDRLIELYGERLVGNISMELYGNRFPLLVKFIDASKDLSIQVHPDDSIAAELENDYGKHELCYVIEVDEGARFFSGLNTELDAQSYEKSVENNTILNHLNVFESRPGDVFYIPAGRIHAIGAGNFIAEVQQASDITYRIYDYNRIDKDGKKRKLHTDKAKRTIDYRTYDNYQSSYGDVKTDVVLNECPYFTTILSTVNPGEIKNLQHNRNSFTIVMVVEGEVAFQADKADEVVLKKGHAILIPAELSNVTVKGSGKILTARLPE